MKRLLVLLENIFSIPFRLFGNTSVFAILQEDTIDKTAAICSGVKFYRGKMGRYSYIGNKSFVIDTQIGSFTSIAPNCYIGGTTHPLNWVSTSPVFHKHKNIIKKNFAKSEFDIFAKTIIGNDVWIGDGVMIKSGLTIGDGAVVGMGSIVTKDVGPYEIWAGNPARMIRKRFSDEIIQTLLDVKWWEWTEEMLYQMGPAFCSIDDFMRKIK